MPQEAPADLPPLRRSARLGKNHGTIKLQHRDQWEASVSSPLPLVPACPGGCLQAAKPSLLQRRASQAAAAEAPQRRWQRRRQSWLQPRRPWSSWASPWPLAGRRHAPEGCLPAHAASPGRDDSVCAPPGLELLQHRLPHSCSRLEGRHIAEPELLLQDGSRQQPTEQHDAKRRKRGGKRRSTAGKLHLPWLWQQAWDEASGCCYYYRESTQVQAAPMPLLRGTARLQGGSAALQHCMHQLGLAAAKAAVALARPAVGPPLRHLAGRRRSGTSQKRALHPGRASAAPAHHVLRKPLQRGRTAWRAPCRAAQRPGTLA